MSWWPVKDKSEVDVDQVASFVDHNVSIMTILDLQDVADYTVGSQAADKVIARFLEFSRCFITVAFQEVLVEVDLESFAELISAVWVRYTLDYAT